MTSSTTSASFTSTMISSATDSSTTVSSTTVSSTTSADPTPTQDTAPVSSGSESGSGEALALKVGLGVSIPLAAVISALAMWWFMRKRSGKKGRNSELSAATPKESMFSSPNQGYEVHEVTDRPVEVDTVRERQELPGTEVHGSRRWRH